MVGEPRAAVLLMWGEGEGEIFCGELSEDVSRGAAGVANSPSELRLGLHDGLDSVDDGLILPGEVFARASEHEEAFVFFGGDFFWNAIEGSLGGNGVFGKFSFRFEVMFGNEAVGKKKGWERGLHDDHGRTVVSASEPEKKRVSGVSGGDDGVRLFPVGSSY